MLFSSSEKGNYEAMVPSQSAETILPAVGVEDSTVLLDLTLHMRGGGFRIYL